MTLNNSYFAIFGKSCHLSSLRYQDSQNFSLQRLLKLKMCLNGWCGPSCLVTAVNKWSYAAVHNFALCMGWESNLEPLFGLLLRQSKFLARVDLNRRFWLRATQGSSFWYKALRVSVPDVIMSNLFSCSWAKDLLKWTLITLACLN